MNIMSNLYIYEFSKHENGIIKCVTFTIDLEIQGHVVPNVFIQRPRSNGVQMHPIDNVIPNVFITFSCVIEDFYDTSKCNKHIRNHVSITSEGHAVEVRYLRF